MTHLLFAYGSLRPGAGGGEAQQLAGRCKAVGPAWTRGRLEDLDGFPALVLDGSGRVDGELLQVEPDLWSELDAYEGVGEPGWYERALVVAVEATGQPRSAWAYVRSRTGPVGPEA